jgi:23S rRNA pseudouridine1911/1915/1917 synthase
VKTLKLKPNDPGRRLDIVLSESDEHSRSWWQREIKLGRVFVNDEPAHASHTLEASDKVQIAAKPVKPKLPAPDLPIVYEDKNLIIVDKPAGLLVHRAGDEQEPSVADFAAEHTKDSDPDRPGIVHRLDRETSGLLIIAKSPEAKAYLQDMFKERQVQKTYLALVRGHLKHAEAIIDLPLERQQSAAVRRAVGPTGKHAVTNYKVIEELEGVSLVEVKPQTGRTHQIRVHFAGLGHPIIGDSVYGVSDTKLGRHFLHASELEFVGPDSKKIKVSSRLPAELQQYLDNCRSFSV